MKLKPQFPAWPPHSDPLLEARLSHHEAVTRQLVDHVHETAASPSSPLSLALTEATKAFPWGKLWALLGAALLALLTHLSPGTVKALGLSLIGY